MYGAVVTLSREIERHHFRQFQRDCRGNSRGAAVSGKFFVWANRRGTKRRPKHFRAFLSASEAGRLNVGPLVREVYVGGKGKEVISDNDKRQGGTGRRAEGRVLLEICVNPV